MLLNYTVPRETPEFRTEKRVPIRMSYTHEGSYVIYRTVKLARCSIGAKLGLEYGTIRVNGTKLVVYRRNGGQWESLQNLPRLYVAQLES